MTDDELEEALQHWPERELRMLAARFERHAAAIRRRIDAKVRAGLARHNAETDLGAMTDAERAAQFRKLAGAPPPPGTDPEQ